MLWPENSTAVDPFLDSEVNAGIREAVSAIGVPVMIGGLVDDGDEHVLNQGIVWDPVTGPGDRYTKQHPVAYGEYIPFRRYWDPNFGALRAIGRDMKSGTRTSPIQVAGIEVADAICFDIAYDDVARDQLQEGAELMTVQTSNATSSSPTRSTSSSPSPGSGRSSRAVAGRGGDERHHRRDRP